MPNFCYATVTGFHAGSSANKCDGGDPTTSIAQLPSGLLEQVFQYLPPNSLASCAMVCKDWKAIATDDILWSPFVEAIVGSNWKNSLKHAKPPYYSAFNAHASGRYLIG